MRKVLVPLFLLSAATLVSLSCGGGTPSNNARTSGLKYRAFISNSVSAGTSAAGVYIVDAQKDVRPQLSPIGAGNTPGMMVVTPNRGLTLVFSGSGTQNSDNQMTFINNSSETAAGSIMFAGMTESIVVSPDSSVAYIALPTVSGGAQQPQGVVDEISLTSGNLVNQISVPSVRHLSIDNSGNRIFGFSDNSDSIAVITPSNVGVGNAVTYIGGFDRPVWAYFTSDDTTAYVLNCGAECGGTQASVQKVDLTLATLTQCSPILCPLTPVPAATVALVDNSTLYLAGTPFPATACPSGTQATTCGLLTIFDLSAMSITNTAPITITDGYHNRIALGASGQLFIGARSCTEIVTDAETRGCLSIYNSLTTAVGANPAGGVLVPPQNGDATGIQPIATRPVVYVVQGGSLYIYSTATDALQETQITNVVGQFIDVKTVDF